MLRFVTTQNYTSFFFLLIKVGSDTVIRSKAAGSTNYRARGGDRTDGGGWDRTFLNATIELALRLSVREDDGVAWIDFRGKHS